MASNDDERNIFDPTGVLRGMQAASIEAWTAAVLRVMGSEEYARVNGALLDSYLAGSAPFHKLVETLMTQFVQSEAYATAMRALLDSYLAGSAPFRSALTEMISSDAYARATGALLDSYLATSAPLRQALESALRQGLAGMADARGLPASFAGWLDPLGVLPAMRSATIEGWAAQAPPAIFQQMIEQSMTQVLVQLNMPTRTDVTSIGDRLGQIELRLDEIESRLDHAASEPAKPGPARKRAGK